MKKDEAKQMAEQAIKALQEELKAGRSEKLTQYLNTMSRFHNYSWTNSLLIAMQNPEATLVAGFQRWLKQGLLASPAHFDFVLGVPGGMPGTPEALMYLVAQLPEGATWTVAGMGPAQLTLGTMAVALGGHVRVGFEDNIFFRKGELATSNAQLVMRMAEIGRLAERPPATPDEARVMLGLARPAR